MAYSLLDTNFYPRHSVSDVDELRIQFLEIVIYNVIAHWLLF